MNFDTESQLLENTPNQERGIKEDLAMRELSRTLSFMLWIMLGGVAAGIFHAYLTLDGWSFSLALVLMLFVTFAIFAMRSFLKTFKEMRLARVFQGRCLDCGYDLRVNPGRCPECGTATIARTGRGTMRL